MTTFELDLSKSDTLIDDIQKIFKPPSVELSANSRSGKSYLKSGCQLNNSNSRNLSEDGDSSGKSSRLMGSISWKKPRANSHEYCDSCGTFEGDRLVCDRCPSSFHLECLDPPIDNEDAPVGVWYCNRCTAIMKEEDDKFSSISASSNNNNTNNNDSTAISNGACHGGVVSAKRGSVHSNSSGSSEITTEMFGGAGDDLAMAGPEKKKSRKTELSSSLSTGLLALQNIQEVVHCLNPREFDLTKDLIPGIKLPNSYKTFAEMKAKSVITMENGIIPRPVVTCFECCRTCMYGSLIQCDYCPLYFHLDCLDPPLVQLPSRVERWMCPNHIEQVIDQSGIIKTIRLSERIKAYETLQKEIAQIDEIDLLTTFASGRGFRFGSRCDGNEVKPKPRIKVPDAVVRMYQFPLKNKIPNGTNISDEPNFNEEQKTLLKTLLRTSCKDIELTGKTSTQLLQHALDALKDLISRKNIDLFSEISVQSSVMPKPGAEQVKSRALLIPLTKDGNIRDQTSIARMIYRNCDIGSSLDNDCVVTGCKYVSPRHASICYLDNHFTFELVNYSRYGTVVDDLLYYNDVSEKDYHKSCQPNQNIRDLRNFLGTNDKAARFNSKIILKSMKSQRDMDKDIMNCSCTEYGYTNSGNNNCMEQGWESTAPLKFGSVIRIGCQTFIFAKVNHSLQPYLTDPISTHPSPISSDSVENKLNPDNNTIPNNKSSNEALNEKKEIHTEPLKEANNVHKETEKTITPPVKSPSNSLSKEDKEEIKLESL